jgi:hypothetical protein
MRQLTSHKVNGLNEAIQIVPGDAGAGNAPHTYCISLIEGGKAYGCNTLEFQNGPPSEGIHGISNEALLAIVEDRLIAFQDGPFKCRENAVALTKLQEAMMWLQKRTRDRATSGVEGTSAV